MADEGKALEKSPEGGKAQGETGGPERLPNAHRFLFRRGAVWFGGLGLGALANRLSGWKAS
jgi:hypothetical protein